VVVAVTIALLPLLAVPSGAGQGKVPKAEVKRFEVKINGRVVTRWSQDVPQEGCNSGVSGSGERSVEYSMERPAPLVAVKFPGSKDVFIYRRFSDNFQNLREAEYTIDAQISQNGSHTFTPPPESSGCPVFDGGGGSAPPPDCGVRSHVSEIGLTSYRNGRSYRWEETTAEPIQAFIDSSRGYSNCPYLGPRFEAFPRRNPPGPTILTLTKLDKGETILDLDKRSDGVGNFDTSTPIEGGSAVTTAFLRLQIAPKGK
jgi:hypothetical protein